jgi:hypothetical protein
MNENLFFWVVNEKEKLFQLIFLDPEYSVFVKKKKFQVIFIKAISTTLFTSH